MGKGKKGGRRQFTDADTLEQERRGMERGRGQGDEESGSEEDDDKPKRSGNKMAQQSSTVGMLPPSDSEDESGDEAPPKNKGKPVKKVQPGDMPPSGSDSDSGSDDGSSSDAGPPPPRRELTRREREALEAQRAKPDPEQVAAEMERLRIVREKRAAQAAARIAAEGFDRYAPTPGSKPEPYPEVSGDGAAARGVGNA
mmetsp:Transcript_2680/g.7872  ORF Transcript_2680/g.7872 Transcript_2680/m.7872 type:complete len:198 (+) Transcript_2680:80-673(+)